MLRSTKIILVVSAALLISEVGLVAANWAAEQARVRRIVDERGAVLREGFAIAKATTELQLSAIANFIADVDEVRRQMDMGREADRAGRPDEVEAHRQKLQQIVGQRWHNLQFRFLLRQLGFYFPDGTAFLRSDLPYRHGDNAARYSAMLSTTATANRPVTGFEIGQWSTGLRAVSPIFDSGEAGMHRFLGMVEVGTSFDPMLVPICPTAECGIAVLLDAKAVGTMQARERDTQFSPDRVAGAWVMEASSNPALTRRFAAGVHMLDADGSQTRIIEIEGGRWFGITTFPLMDFSGTSGATRTPVGMVAVWQEATDLMRAARDDLINNLLIATLGFLLVEAILILSVRLVTRRLEREIAEATAEARDLLRQVTALAERDPLTNLYNRRTFDQRMDEAIAMARRSGLPLSLTIIDLDHFKAINDRHGHDAGDRVITRMAQLIHDLVRVTDVACRWGGEEFVMAMPATDVDQALATLGRLHAHLAAANGKAGGDVVAFTFSAGIAQWRDGDGLDAVLRRADRALYRAKHGGRDRIEAEETGDAAGAVA